MIVMIGFVVCLFLLYVFYYLHNLYVFVAKNIDRRLPSIKLVVSIMLYSMPFQSSLYKAPCCRTLWSWFIHLCIDIDR